MENNVINIEDENKSLVEKLDKFKDKIVCPICREEVEDNSEDKSEEIQDFKVCKQCENKFSPLQVKWKNKISQVKEDKIELDRQINALRNLLNEKGQKIIELQRQLEERENKIYELKEQSYKKSVDNHIIIDKLSINNSKLQNQIKKLENNIKNLEKNKNYIKESTNNYNENIKNLQKDIENKNKEILKLNDKINKNHEKHLQTLSELANAKSDKEMLCKKLEEYEQQINDSNAKLNETNKELTSLQDSLITGNEDIEELNEKFIHLSSSVDLVKNTYLQLQTDWDALTIILQDEDLIKKELEEKTEEIIKNLQLKTNLENELENIHTKIQKIETDFTFVYREYIYLSALIMTEKTSYENIKLYVKNSFDKIRNHVENLHILTNFETLDHEKIKYHPLYKDLSNNLNKVIIKNKEIEKYSKNLELNIQLLENQIRNKNKEVGNYKETIEEIKKSKHVLEIDNQFLQEQIAKFVKDIDQLNNEKIQSSMIQSSEETSEESTNENETSIKVGNLIELFNDNEKLKQGTKDTILPDKVENKAEAAEEPQSEIEDESRAFETLIEFSNPVLQIKLLQEECFTLLQKIDKLNTN